MAVLVPCLSVALFAALYFPQRLNAQAEDALLQRGRTLGALAAAASAPTLKLIGDGLARPEDLDNVFDGALGGADTRNPGPMKSALEGTELLWLSVLKARIDLVRPSPNTIVRQLVQERAAADLGRATFAVPRRRGPSGALLRNVCELDNAEHLVVRCFVKDAGDDALEGLFVAAIDKTSLRAAQRRNVLIGIWSALGASAAGLLLAFLFSGALARPVKLVTDAARDVAGGDVTVSPVAVDAAGELGSMAQSFNEMLASLRELVGQMVTLTGQLAQASQELLSASSEQGQLSGRQAAYTHEIATTFEELARTAEAISSSSDSVEGHARGTHTSVEKARVVFTQLIGDITSTRTESKVVSDSIQALNRELKEVGKIAQLINAFADRSDLLALNAALEGSKAGQVGHGFSLVADEWRRLAENVAGSAKDIERIIERVETTGSEALVQARAGVVTSDKRANIAVEASARFEEILARVRGTTDAAQQISVASKEQQRTSEEAAKGARNVSDLVRKGAEASRRTQEIANQLRGVAEALSQVTRRFKVPRA